MGDTQTRSRRALLTAAASGAAVLAANAALGTSAVRAADQPLLLNATNNASGSTGLTAALSMDTVLSVTNADGSGPNTALQANSDAGTAMAGYTGSGTGVYGDAMGVGRGVRGGAGAMGTGVFGVAGDEGEAPTATGMTGVFGFAPHSHDPDFIGSGVWGDSPDVGVWGSGGTGVIGDGGATGWGVLGVSETSTAVRAETTTGIALRGIAGTGYGLHVTGKIKLANRSGRVKVARGRTRFTKSVAGVTSSSIVIAVLQQAESGTWVRAAVPAAGKFTVYFNRALPSSSVVGWMILN
jgi:hypothetical protein